MASMSWRVVMIEENTGGPFNFRWAIHANCIAQFVQNLHLSFDRYCLITVEVFHANETERAGEDGSHYFFLQLISRLPSSPGEWILLASILSPSSLVQDQMHRVTFYRR